MRKRIFTYLALAGISIKASAEARFPKPDFTTGYEYPEIFHGIPFEHLWNVLDIVLLVAMMCLVTWAAYTKRSRKVIYSTSIVSVLYYGFFRSGCVCSVGSIQNVVLALTDSTYHLPLYVALLFLIPIIFALIFGRVFCSGVCPLGAIQELVNVRNFRISRAVSSALSIIPWMYLAFTILYAATRSQFLICRFDPFIGIFRLGGDMGMIVFGIATLLLSTVVGRPFCQFLCPYGALLSVFSSLSWKKLRITDQKCINCALCSKSCPVDAIRTPQSNKHTDNTGKGNMRVLLLVVLLPLFTLAGGMLVGENSEALSRAHKDVYLYDLLIEQQNNPEFVETIEVETFHAMGRKIEDLQVTVDAIQQDFKVWSWVAGALIGFVIGFKLLKLSLKRKRPTYEILNAHCTMCGRCFNYCPQNLRISNKDKITPQSTSKSQSK